MVWKPPAAFIAEIKKKELVSNELIRNDWLVFKKLWCRVGSKEVKVKHENWPWVNAKLNKLTLQPKVEMNLPSCGVGR